jgi:hypothetical protein
VLLSEKLPPVPLPVDDLEGTEEVLEDMNSEEEAVEEARDRTRARKLGMPLPEPAGGGGAAALEGLTGEARRKAKKKMAKKKKAAQASIEAEEKRQFEELVQKKMGIMYWLMPWTREAARSKVKKIQAINKQLEALEKAAADQMAKDAGKKK